MRKFCSTCGGQLELSKRFCTECGAGNPFFVPAFSLLGDQSGELERLRIEKERIERELQEKEQAHAEFLKQEELKRQLDELQRQKRENLEREKIERERIEADLKNEISRVKEESENYKKKTISLLREIQDQLQQKIEEGKVIEDIPVAAVQDIPTVIPIPEPRIKIEPEVPVHNIQVRRSTAIILFMIFAVVTIAGFAYYNIFSSGPKQISETSKISEPSSEVSSSEDSMEMAMLSKAAIDSVSFETGAVSTPVSTATTSAATESKIAEAVIRKDPKKEFSLTSFRVKADLIGKPISGCGIVIHKLSEINRLNNLILVEKMSSGYLKYKFEIRVVQGNEIYTATPYVYYTPVGRFLKIDGTNCE
ncbi:MAG: hypothetical protein IPP77_12985 [Bacteroidetes bacterium]|nr:hypothetical protein [Bacteroidota bacterium]